MRFVVDTDTGIDDALALMLLASMANIEIEAVTTTHGNPDSVAETMTAALEQPLTGDDDETDD